MADDDTPPTVVLASADADVHEPSADLETPAAQLVESDLLVEDLSIDGMFGV